MDRSCDQCGHVLSADGEPCPNCGTAVGEPTGPGLVPITSWWEGSVSFLASIVFHTALVLILALWTYGGAGIAGSGENVLIGQLPGETLTRQDEQELSAEPVASESQAATAELMEIEPSAESTSLAGAELAAISAPSAGGGSAGMEFDVAISGSGGSGGDWNGMIQSLRRNGLDIVIVFDSTGSMGGEIDQVKRQIERIASTLLRLIPKTQVGLCTYRDEGDEYVVRGLELTNDVSRMVRFLDTIDANGGGDLEEAVHEGLGWAATRNQFRGSARKVILLFGDAPPHRVHLQRCLQIASDFRRDQQGVVSTVSCRLGFRLPDFAEIAKAGGGEAFLTSDERQIMTQLMVLVFGSRHREKVLEAFRLLDE
ncbi:MAG: VWA domain-containing protein [Planctomycetes bacterium]|nr:VWA domain-containing protein [Planctomycetota bacterium]